MLITPNTYFTVLKTVSTGKSKWGFVKIGESQGWVKLSHAKKTISLVWIIIICAGVVLLLGIIVYTAIKLIKKMKKRGLCRHGKKNV